MKRFFLCSSAAVLWLAATGILLAAEYLYPAPAPLPAKPITPQSYTSDYVPYLGGAYRNPDAYLPVYPGYAPYWQSAPYLYPYAYPPMYYPYASPIFMSPYQNYGPWGGHRFKGH